MKLHVEKSGNKSTIGVVGINDKTRCVAWFKLAELVSRKEKEKALNLYRLISHSLDNKAYALQIEGDILWALEDKSALECYTQAAYLYKKGKKLVSAAAVYEHLLVLEPQKIDYLRSLVLLYALLSWLEKFEEKYLDLIRLANKSSLESELALDFTKKLIDVSLSRKKNNSQKFYQEFDIYLSDRAQYKWILNSIKSVFRKNRATHLYGFVKKYCSDNQVNFDA